MNHSKSLNSSSNFSKTILKSYNKSFSTKVFTKEAVFTAWSRLPSETIASLKIFLRRVSTIFLTAIFCLLTFSVSSVVYFLFKSFSFSTRASFFFWLSCLFFWYATLQPFLNSGVIGNSQTSFNFIVNDHILIVDW